ncbi:DUF2213 domain-containing protein [Acinetobacter sp. ANC 4648]|uniref:DUF2213 domain-containing protein n=1 Tax=Acinetobacter sp. ANC 4648 TaxID=1977875 RepID=UPI000A34A4E5|nr:DUF2213 domain-containing protein [Acinetobacter sp. ANC 4648]OTG82360.1 hypothetical protein B9T27_08990 [Acinetobacter sp. ANC 4648]
MFKKKHTKDRQTKDRSNFYTVGKLGKTREVTPEGYLLCRDVAIACTGSLLYGEGEVPVTADAGLIVITRGDDDLFRPETIASFEGKPITDDHPDDWVTPDNWKELSKGTAQNVRRGEGIEDHLLIADLLVQDKDAIEAVQGGKVQISLGYDADYTEVSKGKGVQSNIIGNHVALVDKGRCGSRCSIGDKQMPKKTGFLDSLRKKIKLTIDEALEEAGVTNDSDEPEDDDEEEGKGKTADAKFQKEMRQFMKTMDSRMGALEKKKTKDSDDPEKNTEDDDPEGEPTKDDGDLTKAEPAKKLDESGVEKYTGDSLQDIRARAEILAPGLKLPTLDSASKDIGKVADTAKRNALKLAYATADGVKTIGPFVGGANANIDALPAYTVDAAFIGASELIKQQNNAKGVRTGVTTRDFGRSAPTPADINAKNKAFWNKGQ